MEFRLAGFVHDGRLTAFRGTRGMDGRGHARLNAVKTAGDGAEGKGGESQEYRVSGSMSRSPGHATVPNSTRARLKMAGFRSGW